MGIHSIEACGKGRYTIPGTQRSNSCQSARLQLKFDAKENLFYVKFFTGVKPLANISRHFKDFGNVVDGLSVSKLKGNATRYEKDQHCLTLKLQGVEITFMQEVPAKELLLLASRIQNLRNMPPEQAASVAGIDDFWQERLEPASYEIEGEGKIGNFNVASRRGAARGSLKVECIRQVQQSKCCVSFHSNTRFIETTIDKTQSSFQLDAEFWKHFDQKHVLMFNLNGGTPVAFYPKMYSEGCKMGRVLNLLNSRSDFGSNFNKIVAEMRSSCTSSSKHSSNAPSPRPPDRFNRQNSRWSSPNSSYRYNQRNDRRDGYQGNGNYRRTLPLINSLQRNGCERGSGDRSFSQNKENRSFSSPDKENSVVCLADTNAVMKNLGEESGYETAPECKSPSRNGLALSPSPSVNTTTTRGFYGKSGESRRDYLDYKSDETSSSSSPSSSVKRSLSTPEYNQNKKLRNSSSSSGTSMPSPRSVHALTGPYFMLGFDNTGNSCYINAVLQMLLNNHYFVCSLKEMKKVHEGELETKSLLKLLCNVADHRSKIDVDASESHRSCWAIKRRQILVDLRSKMVEYNATFESIQADCQEFLDQLLEKLKDELCALMKPADQSNITVNNTVSQYFSFTLKETLVCQRCNNRNKKEEEYYGLSLYLPCSGSKLHLSKLMSAYFENDERDYTCPKDDCSHEKIMATHKLVRLPQILIVHLKRVIFNDGTQQKDKRPICFPKFVTLKDWCDLESESDVQMAKPIFPVAEKMLKTSYMPSSPITEYSLLACREPAVNLLNNQSAIPCIVGCGLNGGYLQQNGSYMKDDLTCSMDLEQPDASAFQENGPMYPMTHEEEQSQLNAAVASSLEVTFETEDSELLQVQERSLMEFKEQQNQSYDNGDGHDDEEEIPEDENDGSLPCSYRLTGLACHTGVPQHGHYRSLVYSFKHGKWLLCNDRDVEEQSEESVFKDYRHEACVFFYLRNEIFQQTESAFGIQPAGDGATKGENSKII